MNCQDVNDLLPDFAVGDLPLDERRGVERHLESCEACADTRDTVEALHASRPELPVGLEARVRAAARAEFEAVADDGVLRLEPRRRSGVPSWALGAAALLVLAVGTPLMVDRVAESPSAAEDEVLALAERTLTPSVWASDDGLIAGEPALDGLSDEELLALLEELEAGA
jgi:anti-sigma factor RsiW